MTTGLKTFIAGICFGFFCHSNLYAQLYLLMNDTVEVQCSHYSSGFYKGNPTGQIPSDWTGSNGTVKYSKLNNGKIHFQFEVLHKAKEDKGWIAFCMWQDTTYPDTIKHGLDTGFVTHRFAALCTDPIEYTRAGVYEMEQSIREMDGWKEFPFENLQPDSRNFKLAPVLLQKNGEFFDSRYAGEGYNSPFCKENRENGLFVGLKFRATAVIRALGYPFVPPPEWTGEVISMEEPFPSISLVNPPNSLIQNWSWIGSQRNILGKKAGR